MNNPSETWIRVTHRIRCPKCGKPDNCQVSRDGYWVWCGRVSEGAIRQNAGGQWLHRLDNSLVPTTVPPPKKPVSPRKLPDHFARLAAKYVRNAGEAVSDLAEQLGVSVHALDDLGVGWNEHKQCWTFPERNARGEIIGINRRFRNGQKKRVFESQSGLTFVPDWDLGNGPILLVEGGSDTAALLGLGLSVIGRPSNRAGVDLLLELLADVDPQREITVIGERDEKPDGRWPGKEGAIATAQRLAEGLERSISWSLPPDQAKDARSWLNEMPVLSATRLAALFLDGLEPTVIAAPVIMPAELPSGPDRDTGDWRSTMLQIRIRSLDRPGHYLDRGITGAGKSFVDRAVYHHVCRKEVL